MTTLVNGYKVKYWSNKNWLQIFHHDSHGQIFFKSPQEANLSFSRRKFSILQLITKEFQVKNPQNQSVYEFLLEYPEIDGQYNHWEQTIFPSSEESLTGNIGFTGINTSWTDTEWGGLALSSESNKTFIDGSPKDPYTWHFAIGSYWSYKQKDNFPGPCIDSPNCSISFHLVDLWMRIDDFSLLKYLPSLCIKTVNCPIALYRSLLYLFVIIILKH